MSDLTIMRGDTVTYDITVTRDGTAVPLSGTTLWFTAKRSRSDADASAVIAKATGGSGIVFTDAAAGEAQLQLNPTDTSTLTGPTQLLYDVQLKETDGTITTLVSGTLTITADITRRTS